MSDLVAVTCPHCSSNLKLKDRSRIGQKIACPKCKKPFVAKEKVDEEDPLADLDDMDPEMEEESSSSRGDAGRKKSSGGKRKGKSRRKSSGPGLPIILGGVAVVLLVGVGFVIWSFSGPGGQPAVPAAVAPPNEVAAAVPAPANAPGVAPPATATPQPMPNPAIAAAPGTPAESAPGTGNSQPAVTSPPATVTDPLDEQRGVAVVVDRLPGLPEGLALRGLAGWAKQHQARTAANGEEVPQSRRLLMFDVEYSGEMSKKVVEIGNVQIKKVGIDSNEYLKPAEEPSSFGGSHLRPSLLEAMVDLNDLGSTQDRPRDCVQVRLFYEHPAKPPTKFTLLEGTVTFKIADETKTILIPNLLAQAGVPTSDPVLQAAGFNLRAIPMVSGGPASELEFAKGAKVANVKLVTSNGEPLPPQNSPNVSRSNSKEFPSYGFLHNVPLVDGMAASVMLHTKFSEITVPFRFENVPVAASPENPYEPEIPWKPSAAKVPEGLVVDGHVRWEIVFDDGPRPHSLRLDVDVTGPKMRHVAGVGFLKISKAVTNTAGPLQNEPQYFAARFVPVDSSGPTPTSPPDGIRIPFEFRPTPPAPFTELEAATGSLKVLVAEDRKVTRIENLLKYVGKPIGGADLQAAGIMLKTVPKGTNLDFELTKGHPFALGHIRLIRRDTSSDKPFEQPVGSFFYNGSKKQGTMMFGAYQLVADDAIDVTYYTGVSEIEVPFSFEHLSVPPRPTFKP